MALATATTTATATASNTYSWKIDDIATFKKAVNCFEYSSPVFEMHGFRWSLCIFPNGSQKSKKGNVNYFVMLKSMPPAYNKITVNIKLKLIELNILSSFPFSFTDNRLTSGWLTGTLRTNDIINLNSITFSVEITLNDIYGINGNLISDNDQKMNDNKPLFTKQSSELILDSNSMNNSRLDALSASIESLTSKMDNITTSIQQFKIEQEGNDDNFNNIVADLNNIKKILNINKTDLNQLNDNNKQLKLWLQNECKLGQYFDLFMKNGIEDLFIAKLLTMDTITDIGITKIGHKIKILHQIDILKQNKDNNLI